VGLGGEDDGVGVAAADGDDEGDGQIAGGAHDHAVALFETSGSETEAAEAIGGERVDAGLVEDEVWVEIRHLWEKGGEGAEVFVVGDAGVEFDVDGTLLLAQREVGFAVNRDGEDGRVVAEDVSGAVALVDVEIEDGDAGNFVLLQAARGDRDVVEDAEAGAFGGEGVVGASGESAAPSGGLGFASSGERCANRGEGARDQCFRPGEADAANGGGAECAVQKGMDVIAVMGERDGFDVGERGGVEGIFRWGSDGAAGAGGRGGRCRRGGES
jgi:hypothetical protein